MAKKVFLGMPGYGSQSAGAARAFYCATNDPDTQVDRKLIEGSLLSVTFNQLWCWALNCEDVEYFAMLHSDVEPLDGWLDVLIEELDERKLDVLSVVIPLKMNVGLTSTALHNEGDNWNPLCRLTLREVFNLPETFTEEDTGYPLLLNTGCWVCRFNRSWATQVHFEINDRIVFDKSTGLYVPQVEPEDWFFSRLCNEMKLKIGATTKVKLNHRGSTEFSNLQPWGHLSHDESHTDFSPIPHPEIVFPYDVPGWLLPEEGYALAVLVRGKKVLEIGSYQGKSTICMAQTAGMVTSIDPHDGRGTTSPQRTDNLLRANLAKYDIENVFMLVGVFDDVDLEQEYDVVFIDGAHDAESVRADIQAALSVLVEGGVIAFHDYQNGIDPGVSEAVDEFIRGGAQLLSKHGTVAVVLPPSTVLMEA